MRATAGQTAENAWDRGYYLSTSIEGSQYNFNAFKNQPSQATETAEPRQSPAEFGSNPSDRPRDINAYVNYEVPRQHSKAKDENLERDPTWIPQNTQDYRNGKANFGSPARR